MRKKTKQIYAESLLVLLKKSSYNVITISEICDNTSLSRRTFYNNFNTKDDVVRFICENMMTQYIDILRKEDNLTLIKVATIFCRYGESMLDVFKLLIQNNIYHIFIDTGIKNISIIHDLIPNNILSKVNETQRKYTFLVHSVGAFKMFEQWIISGMKESSEELASIYASIIRDVQC
ncbi:MAG: TetR/AcrR family transcriptional regulator [Rikenellaceae bacterium]